jgi:predicted transcriptional regulator YheO
MKKKIHPILKSLKPLVKALGKTLGENCEIVLHDCSNPQNSIIIIVNGYITGRKVGAPMTDLALRMLKSNHKDDMIINYENKTKDGRKLRSTTVFIRDEKNKIIGCLCINLDLSKYLEVKKLVDEFCTTTKLTKQKEETPETFAQSPKELLHEAFKKAMEQIGKPMNMMQKEDRMRLIELLNEMGIFAIKEAVDLTATELGVSRYTVYNYLRDVRVGKKTTKSFP